MPTFGFSTPFAVLAPSFSLYVLFLNPKLHPKLHPHAVPEHEVETRTTDVPEHEVETRTTDNIIIISRQSPAHTLRNNYQVINTWWYWYQIMNEWYTLHDKNMYVLLQPKTTFYTAKNNNNTNNNTCNSETQHRTATEREKRKNKTHSLTSHCCCVVLCWWCSQVNREKEEAKKSLSPPSCIRLLWSSSCVCCVWRVYQHSLRKYEQLIILSNTRPHIILCVYHTSIHTYEYIRHTSCFIFIFLRIW